MKYKLSILIPTVPNRYNKQFQNIIDVLNKQIGDRRDVEVIGLFDNKMISLGEKRNYLLSMANGEYLTFIDDDDKITDDYLYEIMNCLYINPNVDCIVYNILCHLVDTNSKRFCRYGIEYKYWTSNDGSEWTGLPAHTMIYKSSIAKNYKYLHINTGEDTDWVKRASCMIIKQIRIDKVLYHYYSNTNISETYMSNPNNNIPIKDINSMIIILTGNNNICKKFIDLIGNYLNLCNTNTCIYGIYHNMYDNIKNDILDKIYILKKNIKNIMIMDVNNIDIDFDKYEKNIINNEEDNGINNNEIVDNKENTKNKILYNNIIENKMLLVNDSIEGIHKNIGSFFKVMVDNIENLIGVDCNLIGITNKNDDYTIKNFENYIKDKYPNILYIIQNSTNMDILFKMEKTYKKIIYLKDNLRKICDVFGDGYIEPSDTIGINRKNLTQQQNNLREADYIVACCKDITISYNDFNIDNIIQVGVDHELFKPEDKNKIKYIWSLLDIKKIGIYVGDYNDIKGWNEMKNIVDSRKDIFFIIITKYNDKSYKVVNSNPYNAFSIKDRKKLCYLYSISDFYINTSKCGSSNTSAIEACLCGLPVIMKKSGIFMDFSEEDRNNIGYFDDDNLEPYINKIYDDLEKGKTFNSRDTMFKYELTKDNMIKKWKNFIDDRLSLIIK